MENNKRKKLILMMSLFFLVLSIFGLRMCTFHKAASHNVHSPEYRKEIPTVKKEETPPSKFDDPAQEVFSRFHKEKDSSEAAPSTQTSSSTLENDATFMTATYDLKTQLENDLTEKKAPSSVEEISGTLPTQINTSSAEIDNPQNASKTENTASQPEDEMDWQLPVIQIGQDEILVNYGEPLEIEKYFQVINGSDNSPIIQVSSINIVQLGSQECIIRVTDSKGHEVQKSLFVKVNGRPVISIKEKEVMIPINSSFNPLEYIYATDLEEGNLTQHIQYLNLVNTSKEGTYYVFYSVKDSNGAMDTARQIVHIQNTPPKILVPDGLTLKIGETFNPLSVISAEDKEDGNISLTWDHILEDHVNTQQPGVYKVVVGNVTDKNGKAAYNQSFYVQVLDQEATHEK